MNGLKGIVAVFLIAIAASGHALDANGVNVLSFYASGNSLDGQPLVNTPNVLRFFPIFRYRDSTKSVSVAVYYGSSIHSCVAVPVNGRRYWEIPLPILHLGDAIQRIEIETELSLDASYAKRLPHPTVADSLVDVILDRTRASADLNRRVDSLKSIKSGSKDPNSSLHASRHENALLLSLQQESDTMKKEREKAVQALDAITRSGAPRYVTTSAESLGRRRDSLVNIIAVELEASLSDTGRSGSGILKSDLIISSDLRTAKIMYRNYKPGLRKLVTLDPAEKLGIFRVRYIPFALYRNKLNDPGDSSKMVFEFGLNFGDATIAGDDFVVPELSLKRMGVALALSEGLFKGNVLAIAMTYDFNSYGSLGAGFNFPKTNEQGKPDGREMEPYFSLGINKKAFQDLLAQLNKIFE